MDGKELFLFPLRLQGLPSKVRGVLGEDFLQNFDLLIDYRHQIIQLESGLGSMSQTLRGEHLPIQLSGTVRENPPSDGSSVRPHTELGDNSLSLLLDSGANILTLFRENLGAGSNQQAFVDNGFRSLSLATIDTRTVHRLSLGKSEVYDITVIAVGGHPDPDVDGVVPTSIFHSIFISHQGKFVILNPSFPKGGR